MLPVAFSPGTYFNLSFVVFHCEHVSFFVRRSMRTRQYFFTFWLTFLLLTYKYRIYYITVQFDKLEFCLHRGHPAFEIRRYSHYFTTSCLLNMVIGASRQHPSVSPPTMIWCMRCRPSRHWVTSTLFVTIIVTIYSF